jgi:hypothetical protein
VHRKPVSQDVIVAALKATIEQVLERPGMFVDGVLAFRWLLVGHVDALSRACSGYAGGFRFEGVPQIDPARTSDENASAITAAVRRILAAVPPPG